MNKIKVRLIQGQSGQEYIQNVELCLPTGKTIKMDQRLEEWQGEKKFKEQNPDLDIKQIEIDRPFQAKAS